MKCRAQEARVVVVVVTEVSLIERGDLLGLIDEPDPLIGGLTPRLFRGEGILALVQAVARHGTRQPNQHTSFETLLEG